MARVSPGRREERPTSLMRARRQPPRRFGCGGVAARCYPGMRTLPGVSIGRLSGPTRALTQSSSPSPRRRGKKASHVPRLMRRTKPLKMKVPRPTPRPLGSRLSHQSFRLLESCLTTTPREESAVRASQRLAGFATRSRPRTNTATDAGSPGASRAEVRVPHRGRPPPGSGTASASRRCLPTPGTAGSRSTSTPMSVRT